MRFVCFACLLAFITCSGALSDSFAQSNGFEVPVPSDELFDSAANLTWTPESQVAERDVVPLADRLANDLGRYFSVAAGANWADGSRSGYAISATVGKRFRDRLRLDLEFVHRSNREETAFVGPFSSSNFDTRLDSNSIMSNLFYDWKNKTRFTPYFGAGIGISFIQLDARFSQTFDGPLSVGDFGMTIPTIPSRELRTDISDTVFAGQFTAGVSMPLRRSSDVFVEYRYFRTTTVENEGRALGVYDANNLLLGFRRRF